MQYTPIHTLSIAFIFGDPNGEMAKGNLLEFAIALDMKIGMCYKRYIKRRYNESDMTWNVGRLQIRMRYI